MAQTVLSLMIINSRGIERRGEEMQLPNKGPDRKEQERRKQRDGEKGYHLYAS